MAPLFSTARALGLYHPLVFMAGHTGLSKGEFSRGALCGETDQPFFTDLPVLESCVEIQVSMDIAREQISHGIEDGASP